MEGILQKLATSNKTHLQSPEQNMIGEMEKEKSTRALKGSSHIYSIIYIYRGHSMKMSIFLSLAITEILHLKTLGYIFYIYFKMKQCVI